MPLFAACAALLLGALALPAPVRADSSPFFTATAGNRQVRLTWVAPEGTEQVIIRRSTKGYPFYSTGGFLAYDGTDTTFEVYDYEVKNAVLYYYRAWSVIGGVANEFGGQTATPDGARPGHVEDMRAFGGDHYVAVSWSYPPDGDVSHVTLTRSNSGCPEDENDGTQVYSGLDNAFIDVNAVQSIRSYYLAVVWDSAGNRSPGACRFATPHAPVMAVGGEVTLWRRAFSVYGSGTAAHGEFGNGNVTSHPFIFFKNTGHRWSHIVAGSDFMLGLEPTGGIFAWGSGVFGQLANNRFGPQARPSPARVAPPGNGKWQRITANGKHAGAIDGTGNLYMWGYNATGQLGDGSLVDNALMQAIPGPTSQWRDVKAGFDHTLAIQTDGKLYGWGNNADNQVNAVSSPYWLTPVQIGTDANWALAVGGLNHSAALKTDGTLWTWGNGSLGQLGHGNTNNVGLPTQMGGDSDWAVVAVGHGFTIALKTDGTLWAWGDNTQGQCGLGGDTAGVTSPTQVGSDNAWIEIVVGEDGTGARKSDGTWWVWGHNATNKLGTGTTDDVLVPTPVTDQAS